MCLLWFAFGNSPTIARFLSFQLVTATHHQQLAIMDDTWCPILLFDGSVVSIGRAFECDLFFVKQYCSFLFRDFVISPRYASPSFLLFVVCKCASGSLEKLSKRSEKSSHKAEAIQRKRDNDLRNELNPSSDFPSKCCCLLWHTLNFFSKDLEPLNCIYVINGPLHVPCPSNRTITLIWQCQKWMCNILPVSKLANMEHQFIDMNFLPTNCFHQYKPQNERPTVGNYNCYVLEMHKNIKLYWQSTIKQLRSQLRNAEGERNILH